MGDVTGIDAGTAITISDGTTTTPQVAVTSSCNTAWNSAKSLADGLTTCAGLACVGTVTGLTAGTLGIDVGTGATPSVSLDLSELTDMTGAINTSQDELILLDNGAERRKLFSEIFGSNAYNSTTIPTNNNQLTNGAGFTTCTGTVVAGDISSFTSCTGTTTPSNTQTFTNKSGNISQWTNDSGYTTCTGTVVAGDISSFTTCTGTLRPSGTIATNDFAKYDASGCLVGRSCTETRSDLGIGTAASCTAASLDQSSCAGILCTGTTTASNTQTFTNKSGNISQWTNNSGYTTCTGDITGVTAGLLLSGGGTSGSVTLGLDSGALAGLDQSACAGLLCTGTTTASNTQTFTNKSGSNSQWTNDAGYTGCTGTTTPSNTQTFTNKSGNISQWTNDSGYTTCTGDITGVTAGLLLSGGGASGSVTLGLDSGALEGYTSGFDSGGDGISIDCSDMTAVEVSVDSTVVRTSGNQLVAGIKCFSSVMCTVGNFCAQSQILSGGQDLHALLGGGGGTTYTGGCGITVFGTLISGCFDGDYQQKILTNCGSVCLGKCAGKSIVEGSGVGNIAIGNCTLCTVSTGDANLGIGKQALQSVSTGSRNVAIGDTAGFQITGSDNLVFGRAAGCGITSGSTNVAIGNYAMRTTTNNGTSIDNVAIGNQALKVVTSGSKNVAIGFCANQNGTTGGCNISIGACANATGALNGTRNIAMGEASMWKTTSGNNNIAMGFVALGCNQTGSCNIAIGYTAGRFTGTGTTQMTSPNNSIFIGNDSTGGGGASSCNEIVLGFGAVGCGNNKAMIGNSSLTHVCSNGTFSTVSDLRDKTCICNIEYGLDFIGNLKPKTFNMITDRNDPEGSISCKRHGFIAQEVLEIEDGDPVIINTDNPLQLGYTGEHIIPILVKGMQEQQAIIEDLKERLEVLEG